MRATALACVLAAAGPALAATDPKAAQFFEDALVRFEKKDFPGAIIQLKNSLKIDAKQLPVQMLLGRALLANGDVGPAEVAFNEASALGVNRAEVVVPLAQALVGQARLQEVLSGAKFSASGLPPGVKSQLLLLQAAAQSDLSGPREALKLIDEARSLDPNNVNPWLAEVPVRIRGRQFKEAVAAADKALAMAPNNAEAHYLRGSVAHVQGDIAAAMAAYSRTLALDAAHNEARVARAGLALDQNRLEDVMVDVTEARKRSPLDPRPPYLGALVAERKGDAKASRAALADVAGMLDPIPVEFMRYRPQMLILGGLAHYSLNQYEKARPYLEGAVRQQPDSPVAKLLSQIYLSGRNHDRAIETLEQYLKFKSTDQHATVLLATAQLGKGRHARAAQLLQDALKLEDNPRMRTFLGVTLVGGGKRNEALIELENAYRRDPNQVIAGAALVDLYLGSKQPAKALQIAETLVQKSPKEAQLHTLLGSARLQAGDLPKARAALEQAAKLDPKFLPAQIALARLESQAGNLDAAAKRLEAVLAGDEKHIEALLELGAVSEKAGRFDDASRFFEKAADHSGPRELKPALVLVEHHLRAGRPDAANTALNRLNTKAPDALPVLMSNASVRLAQRDYTSAQQFLTRASRAAEFDPQLQTQIAVQQMAAQDAKGAAYSLSKALQGQPDFLPARALMVDAQVRLNDLPAAEQAARDVSARAPASAVGHALIGDVAMARRQWGPAIEAYKKAHQIEPTSQSLRRLFGAMSRQDPAAAAQLAERWLKGNPKDADVRRTLADGYARSGNLAAARTSYEALVAQTPADADALNNLANILLLSKDPGALKVAEAALARKPQAAYIVGTAGWAAFQAGQPDRALQLLRDARLRDPGNLDTRYFLGAVLASKGRSAEAKEELVAALKTGGATTSYGKEAETLLATLK